MINCPQREIHKCQNHLKLSVYFTCSLRDGDRFELVFARLVPWYSEDSNLYRHTDKIFYAVIRKSLKTLKSSYY